MELWIVGVGLAVLAAVGRGAVVFSQRRARLPGGAVSRIAKVEAGKPIRIRGTVQATATLAAPYTGRPCVYWRLVLRVDARTGDIQETSHACDSFEVRDESGIAVVLAERAEFRVTADIVEIDRASALTPHAIAVLQKHGFEVPQLANVELCEAIVPLDENVEVAGEATLEPSRDIQPLERGYRDQQAFVPVFSRDAQVTGEQREPRYIGRRA